MNNEFEKLASDYIQNAYKEGYNDCLEKMANIATAPAPAPAPAAGMRPDPSQVAAMRQRARNRQIQGARQFSQNTAARVAPNPLIAGVPGR
jgi:hypothetical protein